VGSGKVENAGRKKILPATHIGIVGGWHLSLHLSILLSVTVIFVERSQQKVETSALPYVALKQLHWDIPGSRTNLNYLQIYNLQF
jgi:hypothetical protein